MFSVKMGDESHHSMAFGCGTSLTIQPQPWLDRNDIAVVGLNMSVQLSRLYETRCESPHKEVPDL